MIKKVFWGALWAWLALGAGSSLAATVTFPQGMTECTYGVGTNVDYQGAITVVCATDGSRKAKLIAIPVTGCSTYNKVDVISSGEITITCSGSLTAQPQTQAITFSTAPTVTVGGTGTVSATASSGLAVTFTSPTTGICTVSGSTVTGVAAGTCTIAANQAGNGSYNPAPQVTQNINVTVASVRTATFTKGASGCVYATVGVDLNGSINIECSVSGTAKLPTATFSRATNSCVYTTADVDINGSFSVLCNGDAQAKQTITFNQDPTVTVGKTGTVSAIASSGLPVTFTTLSKEVCTVSGNTVTGVMAGTCTIAANQAGNSIFSLAPQSTRSFSIANSKQSQTITFGGSPTITAGKTGTVSATASSGLAVTFTSTTTGICTVSGTTVTALKANKRCRIVAAQGGNTTYEAASKTQTFCIGNCPKIDLTPMVNVLME